MSSFGKSRGIFHRGGRRHLGQRGAKLTNILWHSEAIWRHHCQFPLLQVIACWLTALGHCLAQYRLFINEIPWHALRSRFAGLYPEMKSFFLFETDNYIPISQWGNELTVQWPGNQCQVGGFSLGERGDPCLPTLLWRWHWVFLRWHCSNSLTQRDLNKTAVNLNQIRIHSMGLLSDSKIVVCACTGNAGNVFPDIDFEGNRYLVIPACITARAPRTCRDACRDRLSAVAGKTFQAFPAHAQPAISRIWQEANGTGMNSFLMAQ